MTYISTEMSSPASPPAMREVKIGSRRFQTRSTIAECLVATYQQKTHVFGSIMPTVGGTIGGDGMVFSRGGFIGSHSESVVQAVCRDSAGCEQTLELPASVSPREGSLLLLHYLNDNILYAVRNLSAQQETRILASPAEVISLRPWKKRYILVALLALIVIKGNLLAGLLVAAWPAWILFDRQRAKYQRKALGRLMLESLSP